MTEGSYFVDHKRGEIMELRAHLRNKKIDKDPKQKRDVLKKIIAYMTLGIDVSSLFSDMVMATNTRDLVEKKMVYLYLCTYASSKPDLTLLAVNTLQRDCRDDDPMIRGLALRSLCSLRVNNLVEYVMQPIRFGLTDGSAYVRKTAVMGVAKLFAMAPQLIRDSDLVDILYNMIKDKDALVVVNAINALNEVLIDEGGMAVNKNIVHHLLSRLPTFNEWAQITILDLVSRYKPTGNKAEEEIFEIMNLLEDRLRHSNSALVLSTTKVFLKLTEDMPNVNQDVHRRIKTPLLTFISNPNQAIAYPVIAHAEILARKYPSIWADSYKHFFCRFNDALCVKELKVKILSDLANDSNAIEILAELSEYITDVYVEIARLSIQTIGKICIRVGSALDAALEHLMSFLDMGQDYVVAETCVAVKTILRKWPDHFEEILTRLKSNVRAVEETQGKCAVLWLIGEYGHTFREAPYILEEYIDRYQEEAASEVKLELLSATMKLFFKRAPEVQKMLGRLLNSAISDTNKIDVRDRAVFYYRLLQYDVKKAEKIVNCPKVVVDSFADPADNIVSERIYQEFNTLAVIYHKPSALFVNEEPVEIDDEDENEEQTKSTDKQKDTSDNNKAQVLSSPTNENSNPQSILKQEQEETDEEKQSKNIYGVDLLGLNIEEDVVQEDKTIDFNPNVQCDPKTFQQLWKSLENSKKIVRSLLSPEYAQQIEKRVSDANFKTMAKGTPKPTLMKFYFYCSPTSTNDLHFIECLVNLENNEVAITVKGQSDIFNQVSDFFESILSPLLND